MYAENPEFDLKVRLEDKYESFRNEVKGFFKSKLLSHIPELRANRVMPKEVVDAVARSGLVGLMIPTDFGGRGLDCLNRLVVVEAMSELCPEIGSMLQIAQLGSMSILDFGNDEQRSEWLPKLASGERICTIGVTESESGSHIGGSTTTYRSDGRGFVLTGDKYFIGNAPISNLHAVLAKEDGGRNFSMFIVEGERSGVNVANRHVTCGMPAFPIGQINLRDVWIPAGNVLGMMGRGRSIAQEIISRHGRLSITGLALGIHRRILSIAIDFTRSRKLYGEEISQLSDVRTKVFDIYRRLETARSLAYRAAELERDGHDSARMLALAKYVSSESAVESAVCAAQIFGARANLPEYEIAQLTLDAYMTQSPSGTGDILRRRVLEDLYNERSFRWSTCPDKGSLAAPCSKIGELN